MYGVNELDYHADRASLSVSGAKILTNEGPAAFAWERENPTFSDAFDFGSAAHAMVLGIGAELVVHEYDPKKVKSPKATNTWKAEQSEARERGAVLLLPDEYAVVRAMADRLMEHKVASQLLGEGEPEVSAYAVDPDTGVMRRGRVDWLGPRIVTDYKTAAGSVHPRNLSGRYGTVRKWGYDRQAAWYLDLLRDCGHPATHFAFIFQAKAAPYSVTVAVVPEDQLHEARSLNADALRIFRDCTDSGDWPDVVPDDSWAAIDLYEQTYYLETA